MKTSKTKKATTCVGCGQSASHACPECHKPTCRRATGFCGHVEGVCALCVEKRLLALTQQS